MEFNEEEQQPLYTSEDMVPPVDNSQGDFPISKAISALATGESPEDGPVDFYTQMDATWNKVAAINNADTLDIADRFARTGNVSGYEMALVDMQRRMALASVSSRDNAEAMRQKMLDISQAAAENVASKSYPVIFNNTPEEVVAVVDKSAKQMSAASILEKYATEGKKIATVVGGLLYEFTPFSALQGVAIDAVAVKYGVPKDAVKAEDGRNKTISYLQTLFNSLDDDKKEEWANNLYKDLKESWLISDWMAAITVAAVVSNEEKEWDNWEDWLDRLGAAGAVASGVFATLKATGKVRLAKAMTNAERTLAATGGKDAIVAAESAKVLAEAASKQKSQAAGIVAAELTGVSAAIDLAKLVSVGASKVLPDAITSAMSFNYNKLIAEPAQRLVDELKATVAAKGIKSEEAAEQLKLLENTYSPAVDPHIHTVTPFRISDDGLSISGTVVYKPANSNAFLTKEAAEAFAASRGKDLRVVPDTTNTNFYVEEDVVKTLELEKAAAEAQLAELAIASKKASKRASKAKTEGGEGVGSQTPQKPVVEPPKALLSSKPKYGLPKGAGVIDLQFTDNVDKAAYQLASKTTASKSDAEVAAWIKSATGWSDAQIKAHGEAVRNNVKSATKSVDVITEGVYKVPTLNPDAVTIVGKEKGTIVAKEGLLSNTTINNIFNNTSFAKVGSASIQEGVQPFVAQFISSMGKALGMEDHPIAVVQMSSLIKGSKQNKAYAELVSYVNKYHPNAGALFLPTPRGSIIVMRSDVSGSYSLKAYMSDFAHEFGHAFEQVFQLHYAGVINSSFNKWLRSKKIKFTGVDARSRQINDVFPLEALLEYRSLNNAEHLAAYIDDWFAGDKAAYLAMEGQMHQWLSSYSEFFAEQFSKWAFTDEVPTTILGQAFIKLVNGFKAIVAQLQTMFNKAGMQVSLSADKNIATMLNEHVKQVRNGAEFYKSKVELLAKEAKKVSPTMVGLQKKIEAITEQLSAIEDAKKGLKHGWLVVKDVSAPLDYKSIGKYTDEDITSATRFHMGDWALKTSSELYADRVVGVHQQSRYLKLLTEFVQKDIEKLSKAERVALDNALVLGDKEGKVFDDAQLRGMDMSKNAIVAYYKVRQLRDIMYAIRNDVAVRSLTRQGYVRIESPNIVVDADGPNLFGRKVVPSADTRVFNTETGKTEAFDADRFAKENLVVFEFVEPVPLGGKVRKTVAVNADTLKTSPISTVIPYRAGEYRRIYTDEYFVKISGDMDVDGKVESVKQTHRTAASAKEAEAYVAAFNKAVKMHAAGTLTQAEASKLMEPFGWKADDFIAELDSGRFGENVSAEYVYNRTDDDYINESISIGSSWSSKRGDKLPNVHGETSSNTLSPLDSIAAEIGNTAYVASVAEWRESHIHKWFNTFREWLPKNVQSMAPVDAFKYMLREGAYVGQSKQLATAKTVQDYIIAQMNIPTAEERQWVGKMRQLTEWVEGGVDSSVVHKTGVMLRNSENYPKWLRTVSFHSFFGFNPVQLFVQGMNAFNAIAVSPVFGLKAGKTMPFYRMALMSDNENVWRQFGAANKATLGMEVDEFVETVRLIRRSGLLDGINSTSLYGAETGAFGLFSGFTRKLGATSGFFFNRGEEASRLISFDIARREFISNNKGVAWWTDDALAKILERQDDLTQNMTSANVASWQRGWKSIPTQFIQYQVKVMMNIIQSLLGNKRAFTQQEALQLLVAHGLVMGTAGYMIMPFREIIGQVVNEADLTEEQRLYVQQGIIAGIIGSMSEGETRIGFGERFNTFKFYEELVEGILDPEKPFLSVMAGASGGAIFNVLGGVGSFVSLLAKSELDETTLSIGLTELAANSFSSMNNARKAYIAANNYNYVMSKTKGDRMYEVSDSELFLLALGIPPAKATDYEAMYKSRKHYTEQIKVDAAEVSKRTMLASMSLRNGDEDSYKVHASVVKNILAQYNGESYSQLLREAYKSEPFTQYNKLIIEQMQKDFPIRDVVVNKKLGDY